jgi:hypothetical protein
MSYSKIILRDGLSFFIAPLAIAYFLYLNITISNLNALSVVSVTAEINLYLWILLFIQIAGNFILIRNNQLIKAINFNLYFILIEVLTTKILIKAISLKGTPLPSSDIRGDLLGIYQLAKHAQTYIFSGYSYPPAWPTLIGNLANFFDVNVLAIFKPAEIILTAAAPLFIYLVWRLVFENWISIIIVIYQTIIFNFDYKNIVLNLIIPLIIFLFIKNKYNPENKISINYLNIFIGTIIGLLSLFYFGYLYWLIPFLLITMFISLFPPGRKKFLEGQFYAYLGLTLGISPVIYQRFISSIFPLILILVMSFIIFEVVKRMNSSIIYTSFLLIFSFIAMAIMIYSFLYFRAGDTWIEGGIEKNNPTVAPVLNLIGIELILFIPLMIALYFIISNKMHLIPVTVLIGVYGSSILFMYYIASDMQFTNRVDLWPRASDMLNYTLPLVFLIVGIALIQILVSRLTPDIFFKESNQIMYFIILFLFFVQSFVIGSLGSQFHGQMPIHGFNGAWFAHQGCSNPHEDPMLSKVFENYPEIQQFLRAECSNVAWPPIPQIK